ncbi:MAG: hypothetical protein PHX43_04470 [Alphaproteobacteria bacterium]|nr:hypothetical protein [Alphaproteobacteria bacterium]
MLKSPFTRLTKSIFCQPFTGLPAVVWGYFIFCALFNPYSSILQGNLPDTDDYSYLNQTLDWLQGQSWFDNIQHRLAPPDGVAIHFTRIIQIPIAVLILLFKLTGIPWTGAATLAAVVWPPLLLAAFLISLRWAAALFLPREWTRITSYISLFCISLLFLFLPGHLDHHGVEAILVILAFGSAVRMIQHPDCVKWGVWTGFLLALALAIALEVLPWLLVISSFIGMWLMIKGRIAARAGMTFGLTLYLASAFFLAIYKRPEAWFEADILSYSIVYVILTACIAICCVGVALIGRAWLRYFVGTTLSLVLAAVFFLNFPDLISGPYGAMDKELAELFFGNISEAAALIESHSAEFIIVSMLFPLLALGAGLVFLYKSKGNDCWLWSLSVYLLGGALILAVFYQVRLFAYAQLFSIIPLAVLLHRGWSAVGERYRGRSRFWAEIALVLLVGPLPMVFIPAMFDGRPFNTGIGMFPVQRQYNKCEMHVLESVLRSHKYYGDKSLVIMNMIDTGPELIFRSAHKAIAAPYHSNVRGNKDSLRFFSTKNPEEAEEIARRNNASLIVMCRYIPEMYLNDRKPGAVTIGADGKINLSPDSSMAEKLIYHQNPEWLKEVDIPLLRNYMVFEVKSQP